MNKPHISTQMYDEDKHGCGTLRSFEGATGPLTAAQYAWEEWEDWRMAGIQMRKEDLIVYPNDPGTGLREFAVLFHSKDGF